MAVRSGGGMRIFIGWDTSETVAYHVLAHSIIEKSSVPVEISPIGNVVLPKPMWWRERGPYDTTEFSNARWIVPMVCNYEGWALFMDSDMLCRTDIANLWNLRDDRYAVMCVKHNYQPSTENKAMGKQTRYKRKNWSSVILFNNQRCRQLTAQHINSANGLDLHQLIWLNDAEIGALPNEWNWLVGEYPYSRNAKIVHYTLGGPYQKGYEETDYADDWHQAYRRMTGGKSWN